MTDKPGKHLNRTERFSAPDTPAEWMASFRARLVVPQSQAFVDWAADAAGPLVVLDRTSFEPMDVRPWLGDLSILQRDIGSEDYRYRLFGSNWPLVLGRDLTGCHLSVWPPKVARAIRERVDTAVQRHIPVGAHFAVARYIGDVLRRGHPVFEQVMWPLHYGPGCAGAVLAHAVVVPEALGLNAMSLIEATGQLGVWFTADDGMAPSVESPGQSQ